MCKTAYYWANTWRVYSGPEATDRGKPDRKAGAQIYRPTGTCLRQRHYQIQNARPTLSLAQRSVPRVGRSPSAGIGCAGTLRGRGPSTPPRHPGSGPRYEKRPVEQGWWGASPPSEKQPHALRIFYLKGRLLTGGRVLNPPLQFKLNNDCRGRPKTGPLWVIGVTREPV